MSRDGLDTLSASETVRLVKSKQLSVVETTEAAIDRIEDRNAALNAVIYLDYDGAKKRARDLENRIMRGDEVGDLAGVPTLMKDLFDFRPGWP